MSRLFSSREQDTLYSATEIPKTAACSGCRGTLAFVVRDVLEPETLGAEAQGRGFKVVSVVAPRRGTQEDTMSGSIAAKTAGNGQTSHRSKTSKMINIIVSSAYSASVRTLMPAYAIEKNRKTSDGKSTDAATNHKYSLSSQSREASIIIALMLGSKPRSAINPTGNSLILSTRTLEPSESPVVVVVAAVAVVVAGVLVGEGVV